MRFRLPAFAVVALILLAFALANGGAYRGYFSADDLDNLAWNSFVEINEYGRGIVDPRLSPHNFRPAGHFYFFALQKLAGEAFWIYVLVLQLVHLLNSALLYRLLRKLEYGPAAALTGTLFFAFHMALFDAFWKPMYIFDVVCGAFCLASLLLWIEKKWVLSLICFWLAYKSKEVAIGLPVVLAMYEFLLGERRWKTLLPFFAISLSFGLQAMLHPQPDNDYTLRFTPTAFAKCLKFYSERVLLIPYGGIVLVAAAIVLRTRVAIWGLVAAFALAAPLLFLPGRLFSVYLYVPMIALAAVAAAVYQRVPTIAFVAVVVAWLLVDYRSLRHNRRDYLPRAGDARVYVRELKNYLQTHPGIQRLTYQGAPFEGWGVEGAAHWLSRNPQLEITAVPENADIRWDPQEHRLISR